LSFARWLDAALAPLDPPLFDGQAVARLRAVARYLPATSQVILEARLGAACSRVDLSVQVARPGEAELLAAAPLSKPVAQLLRGWAEPSGPLAPAHALWLEFDLPAGALELPVPVVCARLGAAASRVWLVETLLPALQGAPLSEPLSRLVDRAADALPPGATILYAFALSPRPGPPLRLELGGLEFPTAVAYLDLLAPRRARDLASLAPLFAGVERLHLSFDLGADGLGPRLGLEGSFPRQPAREPRWRSWLERLAAAGLADRARTEAALGWPGIAPSLVRGLSHVKVVTEKDRGAEAKVYLTLVPHGPKAPPHSPSG
jgi:hypothetical protein